MPVIFAEPNIGPGLQPGRRLRVRIMVRVSIVKG